MGKRVLDPGVEWQDAREIRVAVRYVKFSSPAISVSYIC